MDYLPINNNPIRENDARQLNPLVLAFVGDSVQHLAVRVKLASNSTAKAGQLHKMATNEVKAVSQAKLFDDIKSFLTEAEFDIYKRARNSKMNTMAKNASSAEYKKASGFEAIIGYLYLIGNNPRISELMLIAEEVKLAGENNKLN